MEYVPIAQLPRQQGNLIDSFYLIRTINVRQSKAGKEYVDLMLAAAAGEVSAKMWEVDPFRRGLKAGEVVKVRALVEDYMGTTQLNVKIIRLPQENDTVDLSKLVASAPQPAEEMYALAMSYAGRIGRPQVRQLVETLWQENREALLRAPAAVQMHHAVRSGLLYHITTMLRAAEGLLPVYPQLDADWLYAGILLHDLAKLQEMQVGELGLAQEYTVEGQLLGHITMGVVLVAQAGARLGVDPRTLRILEHLVLSHHEVPEFGSPRPPMTPEAEVLQTLDRLDARLYDHFLALRTVEPGGQSARIRSMEGRRLFKADV